MATKKKFQPLVAETAQSRAPIRGRGASWSPANRFEKLHVDLTDLDVVDVDPDESEGPRRVTQFDKKARKVGVSIKALEVAEEKEAIAQYGSSDSGATLGDILGTALKQREKKD